MPNKVADGDGRLALAGSINEIPIFAKFHRIIRWTLKEFVFLLIVLRTVDLEYVKLIEWNPYLYF
jgi:hypothetical protein